LWCDDSKGQTASPNNNRKLQIEKSKKPTVIGSWKKWHKGTKVVDTNNNNKVFIDLDEKPLVYCADKSGNAYLKGQGLGLWTSHRNYCGVAVTLRQPSDGKLTPVKFVLFSDIVQTSNVSGDFADYQLCTEVEAKTQIEAWTSTFEDGDSNTFGMSHGAPETEKNVRHSRKRTSDQAEKTCRYPTCTYRSKKQKNSTILDDLRQHVEKEHKEEPATKEEQVTDYQAQLAEYKKENAALAKEKIASERKLAKASTTTQAATDKMKNMEVNFKAEQKSHKDSTSKLEKELQKAKTAQMPVDSVCNVQQARCADSCFVI
jgi:hypothetical protein